MTPPRGHSRIFSDALRPIPMLEGDAFRGAVLLSAGLSMKQLVVLGFAGLVDLPEALRLGDLAVKAGWHPNVPLYLGGADHPNPSPPERRVDTPAVGG